MPPVKHGVNKAIEGPIQPSLSGPTDGQYSQKTISELFATSKHGLKHPASDASPTSFPSKRSKRNNSPLESTTASTPATIMAASDMYKFPSPSARRTSDVIDLTTSSQNGSFTKKKINGLVRPPISSAQTGPKRLVVKNLKQVSRSNPNDYYNDVLKQLDAALSAIFISENLPYSNESLYKGVVNLCRQDRAPTLYRELCKRCTSDITTRIRQPLLDIAGAATNVEVLEAVIGAWTKWNRQMEMILSIFYYLDRSYLLHSSQNLSIQAMGISAFGTHVFSATNLKPKILQGACDLVTAERQENRPENARAGSESLLRDAIKMFHVLSVYRQEFEGKLVAESEQFYCAWAEQTIKSTNLEDYIEMCKRLMAEELNRSEAWSLDPTTRKTLELHLEEILIDQNKERLLKVGDVGELLNKDHASSLDQLFSMLQRRRLGEKLRPAFEDYIVKQGSTIVFDEQHEQEMVPRLLEFKKKLDQILEQSFQKHEGLGHSLREAFENFINKSQRSNMTWGTDNPKPGEMIAKYVDMILKGGARAIRASGIGTEEVPKVAGQEEEVSSEDEDVEITRQLDQVLDLFRFVHGKAVFEAFYKRDLARRLLLGRSASSDAEKSMLTRLRSECGAGFTHNLEQMFKDIEMAREEISSYRAMLEERETHPAFELSVNVLSSSAWPSYPDVAVNVPENILKATASFEQHYKMKHSGRKLEWKHALAHCQLKASFPKGNKEIVVSSFQAIVMLSFNSNESMSYADLQAVSGLDEVELKRTLQSLACAKYRVLAKNPKGKDVNITDTFSINSSFWHPKYRIKINQIQAKETKQENQQTHQRVAADRNYETQAAIVRIMKSRKTITHAELVSEVIKATMSRGVLDPSEIKKNIEKLIEKDYMERDESGDNKYSYVA